VFLVFRLPHPCLATKLRKKKCYSYFCSMLFQLEEETKSDLELDLFNVLLRAWD